MKSSWTCTFAVAAIVLTCISSEARAQSPPQPELLPEDLEVELARSAAPSYVSENATILVFRRGGYEKLREGTNGFTCLVRRAGAVPGPFLNSIVPVCYDAEGSRSLLPAIMEEARLLESGMGYAETAGRIEAGFADGTFSEPEHGAAYMLSPVFHVETIRGTSFSYVPHIMFYSPYASDESIGSTGERMTFFPFVQAPGLPSAMMVIPVGETERKQIEEEHRDLVRRAKAYYGE